MLTEDQKLERLIDILDSVSSESPITEEVIVIFRTLIDFIDTNTEHFDNKLEEIKTYVSSINVEKGDKGDKGDKPTVGELLALIKPLIPTVKDGKDGRDGRDGRDGVNGKDGETPDTSVLVLQASELAQEAIKPLIPTVQPLQIEIAKNTSDIVEIKKTVKPVIKRLDDIERIQSTQVSLPQTTTHLYKNGEHIGRAKNLNFIEGNGVTFDIKQNGDRFDITVVAGSGSSIPLAFDISSQFNGSATTFTLPAYSSILMFNITGWPPNGALRPTVDFTTPTSTTVSLTSEVTAPESGTTGIILYIPS